MQDAIPEVQDKRPTIAGLLPKNSQRLVLGAVAALMMLVILFSGHNAPKPKPAAPTASSVNAPSQTNIQDYRARIDEQMRKLATEEEELTQTKQAMALRSGGLGPDGSLHAERTTSPSTRPELTTYGPYAAGVADPEDAAIDRERRKRAYESLFASNVALTYRKDHADSATAQPLTASKSPASPSDNAPESVRSHRLFEGTILETVLTNRLDSSFSGPVNCMVTADVYSRDGKLLIPQGSRVLGDVRRLESFGEQRLAVSFHRLIMPDSFSLNLDQFKGLDQIGATGLLDQVNHHYLQVFGVSIALGAIAGLTQSNTRFSSNESSAEAYQQGVAGSLAQSANHILDRYLNVLPTFTIREGVRIKIYLSQDLMLPAYEAHPAVNE